MNIAYTMSQGRGDTDLVLFKVAKTLAKMGYKTAGTVQINTARNPDRKCDMDVQILPAGPTVRISQSLGRASKGCRLDPSALETAVALADEQLALGADILIINKFGKHEADGRGFRDTIATALSMGIPVLVGANHLNMDAFLSFTEDQAVSVAPNENTIVEWLQMQMGDTALVA